MLAEIFSKTQRNAYNGNQQDLIEDLIITNIGAYVNFENGACDFDNQNFRNLLKIIKSYDDKTYQDKSSASPLLSRISVCDYENLVKYEYNMCHEPELIGFPWGSENTDIAVPNVSVSISCNSKYKSEAWNFIKLLLDEDYQNDPDNKYPVLKKSFYSKLLMQYDDMLKPYGGNTQNSKGEHAEFNTMKRSYIDDIIKRIEEISHCSNNNTYINEIIYTETENMLNGNQSEESTSQKIQSRVQLYLNETNIN